MIRSGKRPFSLAAMVPALALFTGTALAGGPDPDARVVVVSVSADRTTATCSPKEVHLKEGSNQYVWWQASEGDLRIVHQGNNHPYENPPAKDAKDKRRVKSGKPRRGSGAPGGNRYPYDAIVTIDGKDLPPADPEVVIDP